ncbi:MAG: 1-deoxy-D-xylulose-5-phosphate reductoisomerase [Coprobacillus sp.]|nr:1-deoxy-D-xylulose-5-phosphate reductoisomerase [Coprobacillus sp.]
MEEILLLGASGSIGSQTLEVLLKHPLDFKLVGISVGHQVDAISHIIKRFPSIKYVYAIEEDKIKPLVSQYKNIQFYCGDNGLALMCDEAEYTMMVNAVSGFAGFVPTYTALNRGKKVALANKESLVVGGELINKLIKEKKGAIYPIDSEHSALTRCLKAEPDNIKSIYLTTSGGSLRNLTLSHLSTVTPAQALKHPTWNMGKLITIESSLMINKAYELVEAHYLYDMPLSVMEVVMEPNSMIHCFVKYSDGHIRLYESRPDMKEPIEFALYGCTSTDKNYGTKVIKKTGYKFPLLDSKRYPAIMYAPTIMSKKLYGVIINAAVEYGINEFLKGEIKYTDIERLISVIIKEFEDYDAGDISLEDIVMTDFIVRERCRGILKENQVS